MFKRVALFLITNILVMTTISLVVHLLGLNYYLTAHGIDYRALALFCLLWGTGGAFISLFLSKFMAKMGMGVEIIDPSQASGEARALIDIIYRLAEKAQLPKMPEVGIYDSEELNAFATGPSKSDALVAVSTGLLRQMSSEEIEGVLGHEITHIANGDMITMTLIQGIVNAFAMFLSRIISYVIAMGLSRGEEERGGFSYLTYAICSMVFDVLFTLLGSIVVAAFSRYREYRADQGGAQLAGRLKMINALKRLQTYYETPEDNRAPALAMLKISHKSTGIQALFASHPPLSERIARLENANSVIQR